jgi:VanZ family protein
MLHEKIKSKIIFRILFWIWFIILHVLILLPRLDLIEKSDDKDLLRLDYVFHMGAYGLLSLLFLGWNLNRLNSFKTWHHLIFIATGGLIATTGEFLQYFLEFRSFNPMDLYFNLAGLLLAYLSGLYIYTRSQKKSR